ncbi:MAG: hypothetical protein OXC46_04355 [Thaumarchaeota archaeon]|nr:hypothetical protein [Nitrososphaerota archaeon]
MLRNEELTDLHKVEMTLIGYKLNPEFENILQGLAKSLNLTMHEICNRLINRGTVLHHASQDKRDHDLADIAGKIRSLMVESTPDGHRTISCRSKAEYHGSITLGVAGGKNNTMRMPDFIVKYIRQEASLHDMTNAEIIFSLIQAGLALLITARTENKYKDIAKILWNRTIDNITFEKVGTDTVYHFDFTQRLSEGKK